MPRAFIGIGSNVNREQNILSGINELKGLGSDLAISTVFESKAYGFKGDNFYNLVIGMDTELSAYNFNLKLSGIEDQHGRERNVPRISSRTLDLDLLIYGDLINHDQELDVPRKDILTYAFVLKPLAEIAGELRHPETGMLIREIWESFEQGEQDLWPIEFNTVT